MKEQDNIVNDYKNTTIELSKLYEREIYLKELLDEIDNKRTYIKLNCEHPLFVYFGRSYYNHESRNTHIAKCICCGQMKYFKGMPNTEIEKFKKRKNVLDLTEFIDPVENFLIPNSTWYEETFVKVKELADEYVFNKEEININELKAFVKEQFEKANQETLKTLEKINRRGK